MVPLQWTKDNMLSWGLFILISQKNPISDQSYSRGSRRGSIRPDHKTTTSGSRCVVQMHVRIELCGGEDLRGKERSRANRK